MGSNFCTGWGHCSEVRGKHVPMESTYFVNFGLIKLVNWGLKRRLTHNHRKYKTASVPMRLRKNINKSRHTDIEK